MKRHFVCLLLSLLLLPLRPAEAQQVRLKANLQFPVANPLFGGTLKRFKDEVERRSEGAIAIEIIDNAQLLTDDRVIDGVAEGTADIGMTALHQFSYKVPLTAIIDMPFLFNFDALVRTAAKPGSEIRTLLDEAILAGAGVRVLWWHSLGNGAIMSKGYDVADPARIKGKRVAAPGKLWGDFVESCGAKASVLTYEKFPAAYKEGAVDMSIAAFGSLGVLWEFTDTVTFTSHSPIEFLLIISERTWASLSSAHRDIIAGAAVKVESETGGDKAASEARTVAFAKSKNVRLQQLTPDQIADWRACSAGMLADYMDRNGEGARRLMEAYARLRTDPCCSMVPGEVAFSRR